jgi:HK97 family phage prohead protease
MTPNTVTTPARTLRRLDAQSSGTVSGERIIPMVMSTEAVNSYGEVVDQSSWRLERFLRNPVALYQHDTEREPIGYWRNVRVEDGALRGDLVLSPPGVSADADRIWARYESKHPVACSVGFYPGRIETRTVEGAERRVLVDCELEEISVVTLPADPLAVTRRLSGHRAASARRLGAHMDIPKMIAAIEEAVSALDPEANAGAVATLRAVLAMMGEGMEMMSDDKKDPAKEEPKTMGDSEEAVTLRARARAADDMAVEVRRLSAELSALRSERDAEARERVMLKHRQRGALTPAAEADAGYMADLRTLSVEALDRVLSRLPGLPTQAVDVRTPKATEATDDDAVSFARRYGVSEAGARAAINNTRNRAAARTEG